MRKLVLLPLIAVLTLGFLSLRPALADSQQGAKPLVVVSLAGYDEMMTDMKFAGDLVGHADLDKNIDGVLRLMTRGKGLAGIDTTRRSGIVISAGEGKPTGYAFVPVKDLKATLALLADFGIKSEDAGDGLMEIDTKQRGKHLFVRDHKGWAFLADKAETLANVPDDPSQLLAGLPKQYDGVIRMNVCNVPEPWRQKLMTGLRKQGERQLKRMPGSEREKAIGKMLGGKILSEIDAAMHEIEQVSLGWALDEHSKTAFVEVNVTALEGTRAAKQFAELKKAKTDLAGFQLPGSAISGNATAQILGINSDEINTFFKAIGKVASHHIETKMKKEEEIAGAKKFVRSMLQVIASTVASGRIDEGGSLVLEPDGITLVGARYVSDGRKLEKTIGMVVEAVRERHPGVVQQFLKTNAAESHGVRMHMISIPIPQGIKDRDKVVQLMGDHVQMVMGFGQEHICWAAGKDALATLEKAIEASAGNLQQSVQPMQMSVSLSEIAEFIAVMAEEKDRPMAKKAAALLKESGGKDHVRMVATPIERGATYRFEIEEGVLKLIAKMATLKMM